MTSVMVKAREEGGYMQWGRGENEDWPSPTYGSVGLQAGLSHPRAQAQLQILKKNTKLSKKRK